MKRGTLLALIAAGVAGWWLGRQAPDAARLEARPQPLARPESTGRAATSAGTVTETTVAAPSLPPEDDETTEASPAPGPADAGRAMRQARSTIDQRMRALRSRPPKSS